MPKSKTDRKTAMLREWYSEVIKHAAFVEATNCDQFLTVWTGPQTLSGYAQKLAQNDSIKRLFRNA